MKNILIPTDFNLASFKLIDCLVAEQQATQVNIIFVHGFKLSGDIGDMLMLGRRSKDLENISDDFYTTLKQYKETHQGLINDIRIEYFYGNTTVAFRNFLDAQEVDIIAHDKNIDFTPLNKYSINPQVLIDRANCHILNLDINTVVSQKKEMQSQSKEFADGAYVLV